MLTLKKLLQPAPIDAATFRRKLIVLLLLALVIYYGEQHMMVTISASVDDRVFWRTNETPVKGDYATFMLEGPLVGDKPVRLTKRLVCWAGDQLSVQGRVPHCNGESLGLAKETGLLGQALPLFEYDGIIPSGKAYAFGSHPDSFDSRYWGFIDVASTERVIPMVDRLKETLIWL